MVDLPEPFSPTRKVTPAGRSRPSSSRAATAGNRAHQVARSAGRCGSSSTRRTGRRSKRRSVLLLVVIEAGQPGGEPLDRRLELGIVVEEVAQPLSQPGQADRLVAATVSQLLDTAIGEVHRLFL